MIEDFEKCLIDNGDLESTARKLKEQANRMHQENLRLIEHDLNFARMIRAGLSEPNESGVYMISRAYIRMYRKKHNPHGNVLAYILMREAQQETVDSVTGKEQANHEAEKRGTDNSSNTKTLI